MTYIAKHYVKIAGRVYTPGELIPGDAVAKLNGERLEWLVGIRAIIACAPAPMPAVPEAEDETICPLRSRCWRPPARFRWARRTGW